MTDALVPFPTLDTSGASDEELDAMASIGEFIRVFGHRFKKRDSDLSAEPSDERGAPEPDR